MLKRILAILLIVTIALVLVSCSVNEREYTDVINMIESYKNEVEKNIKNYEIRNVEYMDVSTEGGAIIGYYEEEDLKYAEVTICGEMGRVHYNYYFLSGSNIYLIKNDVRYDKPFYIEGYEETEEIVEYYFRENEVFYVDNKKKLLTNVDDNKDFLVELEDFKNALDNATEKVDNAELNEYASEYFKDDISTLRYEGQFAFDDYYEEEVRVNMKTVEELESSRIFQLYLDPIQGVPEERLDLGCFYETGDTIYKIEPTEENLAMIKSKGSLPEDSIIVAQNSELPDALGEDEAGFHYYIEIEEGQIKFHSYNNLAGTGYYEAFTWEKGVGLVFYQSGYGAERDSIQIKLVSNN